MHVHASALDFLINTAYLLIALFIIRLVSVRYPDSTVGRALAFIH